MEAKRFARHPLFLFGVAIMLIPMVAVLWQQELDANPMAGTLFIAFLIGVFGFIVAHRLTTSLLRTRDLAGTTPVGRQQRTLALCLACLVPASRRSGGGRLHAGHRGHLDAGRRPGHRARRLVPRRPGHGRAGHPDRDGTGRRAGRTVARRGGRPVGAVPRLGPDRGRHARVRDSHAQRGIAPWRLLSAWPLLVDEYVNDGGGPVVRSNFVPGVEPIWVLFYLLCLCGLAVVAALLRDPAHRRPLLGAGAALTLGAVGSFLLALS